MREPWRSTLKFVVLLLISCAGIAPAKAEQTRTVRRAPATIQLNTLVSIPGQPIRVPLAPPPDFRHAELVWVPSDLDIRLINPGVDGGESTPVAEIIGFTGLSYDPLNFQSWLAPAATWRAVQPSEILAAPDSPVYWMLFIRLPEAYDSPQWRTPDGDRSQALTIQIDRERFPVRLAPTPASLPIGRIPSIEATAEDWRVLGERLAPAAMDPTRRWRISLLLDRVPAPRLFLSTSLDDRFPSNDPVLLGLSDTLEAEWRSALSELAATDPDLGAELLASLTAIIRLPDGTLLPAWPTDPRAESELLTSLLSRTLSGSERAETARRYLQSMPSIRVNVLDDAGNRFDQRQTQRFRDQSDSAENVMTSHNASVLLTNLSTGVRSLTLGEPGEFDSSITRLPPFQARRASFDPSVIRGGATQTAQERQAVTGALVVRDEGLQTRVEFRVAPGRIEPPGQQIGPSLEPWTLASWNTDSIRVSPPNRQTALFMYFDDRDGRWRLMIEARSTPDQSDDEVRVYLGPFGSPDSVIRVRKDQTGVITEEDRWTAIVDLPATALTRVQQEGTLAIGFIRSTAAGYRSSWPRPLLPGQEEPGRARLDLSNWNGRSAAQR